MSYNLTFLENATAIEVINGIQNNVPSFIPLLLLFEFFVIAIGGAYGNARKTGYTNIIQWATLSGLVTTTSAIFLGGIFITPDSYAYYLPILIVCIGITLILAIALMFSSDD